MLRQLWKIGKPILTFFLQKWHLHTLSCFRSVWNEIVKTVLFGLIISCYLLFFCWMNVFMLYTVDKIKFKCTHSLQPNTHPIKKK